MTIILIVVLGIVYLASTLTNGVIDNTRVASHSTVVEPVE
jgi:hypothetical protein